MLSGVELHLPRQMVVPALSTTQTEVCSRDTSSPTYCCCGFMIVLRFVRAEALMLQALASAITGCPDLQYCNRRRAQPRSRLAAGHRSRRRAAVLTAASTAPCCPKWGGAYHCRSTQLLDVRGAEGRHLFVPAVVP